MKVIVAIDDSPYSDYLADTIIHRRWPEHTQFKVLSIIEPFEADYINELDPDERKELLHRQRQHVELVADKVRHRIMEHIPRSSVHFEIRQGDPRDEILGAATDWNADTIMVGAKGRQVCPHNLLGSVSRAIASHAVCSVEIIRKPAYAGKEHSTHSAKQADCN